MVPSTPVGTTANGPSAQTLRENHNQLISTSTTEELGSSQQVSIPPEQSVERSLEAPTRVSPSLTEQTFDFSYLDLLDGLSGKDKVELWLSNTLGPLIHDNVKALLSQLNFSLAIWDATGHFKRLIAGLEDDLSERLASSWSYQVLGGIDLNSFASKFSALMMTSLAPVKKTAQRKSEDSRSGTNAAQAHLSEMFSHWIASFDDDVLSDLRTDLGSFHERTAKNSLLKDVNKMKTVLINHLVPLVVEKVMSQLAFSTIGLQNFPDEENVFRSLILDPLPGKTVLKDGLLFLTTEEFKLLSHRTEKSVVTTCICCGKLIGTTQPFNYCHHLGTCALIECKSDAQCYDLHWIIAVLGMESFNRRKATDETYVHPDDVAYIQAILSSIGLSLVGLLSVFCKRLPLGIQHSALNSEWHEPSFAWTVPSQAARKELQSKFEQLVKVARYYRRIRSDAPRGRRNGSWKVDVDDRERAYAFVHNNHELRDQ